MAAHTNGEGVFRAVLSDPADVSGLVAPAAVQLLPAKGAHDECLRDGLKDLVSVDIRMSHLHHLGNLGYHLS